MLNRLKKYYFLTSILFLCLSYLGLELFYTYFATIGVDEFWFTHWAYRYNDAIPYRDFSPYKTVLGYYFLLAPILTAHTFSHEILAPIFLTKNTLTVLNTLLFFASAHWLKKFFPPIAVLATIALLIFAEFVLTYSTNIRVDFLAYWLCFFSALLLLEKRILLAGIFIALGFLTSQKALWYIIASNAALGLSWICFDRSKKSFLNIVYFNLTFLSLIVIYIAFWSSLSSLKTVLHNMFYEAYIMYQLDWYDSSRLFFWKLILLFNPLPFLLWPLAVLSLFVTFQGDAYKLRFLCVIYASFIMICLIPYKQIFPYYTLTALPAFLLLYSAFFTWQYGLFQKNTSVKILLLGNKGLWSAIFIYYASLLYLNCYLNLPIPYLFISLIPLFFGAYITQNPLKNTTALPSLIWLSLLFFGLIYPFTVFITYLPNKNGNYQKSTLALANSLLQDKSDYVAGIELFYNKNQPISGMKHLGGPAIAYLFSPTPKLRTGMLASLYYAPDATIENIITSMQHSSVKFFVNNYRMETLPPAIKRYLFSEYEHFWGGIYLYAPSFSAGSHSSQIKFSGNYKIESENSIWIDGKKLKPNTTIRLKEKTYHFLAAHSFRLKWLPMNIQEKLDPRFEKDDWARMLS